ncbi:T9SS type A sorting domain-containing protein [Aequorivita sp. SDUM287046]|uniref:T9SS type A sorting domain-containing protein n=1 Tax=Aequorivita aurantiaca TaxID=3053356 RepID=A0ABT8DNC4_9FLAO|nr:T9SS type A sorting domain-containing protein [Aequorivita aurantiaca]MDN3725494.1 T9SS type A sorting domain-containing protein [Aequorivita aurantiaca]
MMKKPITLLFLALCLSFQPSFAQFEVTGSVEFGRIFDLTYDANVPNKIYAVTLGNHIVVSNDNGASWEILYSLLIGQGASIKDLKLSPDGTALTFSAYLPNTSFNEIRVYDIASATITKTFPLPNQMDLAYVSSYDFYDGDMDVLLVDTNFPVGINTEGKTFYTSDGGDNWSEIYYTNNYDTVFLNDVAISPNDPEKLFLTRGNGSTGVDGGLFVSDDAGQNWDEILPGIILDPITFDPTNDQNIWIGTGISFGSTVENLYKSADGGESFSIVPITWTEGILDCINVIRFNENNPSQIIVLEENEIAISEDGGSTWENFVYLDENPESYYYGLNASFNPQNSEEIFISANYVPLFSNDGGETLEWSKSPYFSSTGNMDLFLNGTDASLYYGVQFGYVHRDLNTGIDTPYDIVPLNIFSNNPGQTQYADKVTPNRIYTFQSSFMGSSLKVSNDNGATKTELLSIFTNRFTAVGTFPNEPQTILAAFGGFEANETQLKKIDFSDINNIVVTDITLPALDYIHKIIIDNTGKIMMPIGVEVYSSTDGGTTWTNNSTGLEVMNASDLIFDLQMDPLNADRMALASSKGIFISEDGGENWNRKTTSLVFNVAFSTENEGAMTAATYSSQLSEFALHYSTDSGETWETINNEQLLGIGSSSSTYVFDDNSVTAYIGSFDLGLVEYTIDLNVAGTPDFENGNDAIAIYPNPAREVLNIELKNITVAQVAIYSINGAKILEVENTSNLNISQLAAGMYLIRVKDSNNAVFFKRFVKQ